MKIIEYLLGLAIIAYGIIYLLTAILALVYYWDVI